MAQLIVRNIEQKIVNALKRRAAARGVSAEAEHRFLLEAALLGPERPSFKAYLESMPRFTSTRSRGLPRKVVL